MDLHPLKGVENPIFTRTNIPDRRTRFVADPFALHVRDQWFLFFEKLDRVRKRGQIGLATSPDACHWQYEGVVLSEPFHLSYPDVFSWNGRFFMVPESGTANAILLYETKTFPRRWRYAGSLLKGRPYLDPSLFQWDGRWWMYAAEEIRDTAADNQIEYYALRLFGAPDLFGSWEEHPASPVIAKDSRTARPAGKPLNLDGRLFRFAQDCVPRYGAAVRAFEIRKLTTTEYQEVEAASGPVLAASGQGWNALGMHHVDLHLHDGQWLAFVDGHMGIVE